MAELLSGTREDVLSRWYRIVSEFTNRRITYEDDRLPALSGIASRIHQHLGDPYIVGLWQGDMVRGLTWANRLYRKQRLKKYPTNSPSRLWSPTWAWASRGHGYYASSAIDMEPKALLLDVSTTPLGSNPLGCVASARLSIQAHFQGFRWRKSTAAAPGDWLLVSDDASPLVRGTVIFDESHVEDRASRQYWAVLLGLIKRENSELSCYAMALEQVDAPGPEIFRRVGLIKGYMRREAPIFDVSEVGAEKWLLQGESRAVHLV